jgi:hypothetical protein
MHDLGSMPPVPAVVVALAAAAVFCGVVLPAVWSRRPARRTAAARVLAQLLGVFRKQPRR